MKKNSFYQHYWLAFSALLLPNQSRLIQVSQTFKKRRTGCRCQTRRSQFWLQRSQDRYLFWYRNRLGQDGSWWTQGQDSLCAGYSTNPRPPPRQWTGRYGYRDLYHHGRTQKLYNFTSPYYTDASGFLVNKSAKIKKIEDLNGKTIGVAQGSITQRLITELGKKKGLTFKFVELGSYPELITSFTLIVSMPFPLTALFYLATLVNGQHY